MAKMQKLEELADKAFEKYIKARDDFQIKSIGHIQFTVMYHLQPIQMYVVDSSLSELDVPLEVKFKELFKIINYEIVGKTEALENLSNKKEVLRVAKEWCDKWKKKEAK